MTKFNERSRTRIPQRMFRIFFRNGQKHIAKIPPPKAMMAVLDAADKTVMVDEIMPITARHLDFAPFQSQKNKGSNVPPKVPARMACIKGPCARMEPARTLGTIGTPPRNPKTFWK